MEDGATRITIASRLFPPEPGAAAYRLGRLAAGLSRHGARVRVLTTLPPRSVRTRAVAGLDRDTRSGTPGAVTVRRWPVLRDSGGNVRGYIQFASFDGPLLARLLGTRSDLVVVEPPPTTGVAVRLVSRVKRIPYVYYAADVSSTAAAGIGINPAIVRVLTRVESWVMRGAAHVLAVSEGVATEVRALGVDPARVTVVGTGVDTDTFQPQASPDDQDVATLVYAGTMSEIHGAEVFVRAFGRIAAEHPGAELVMLGQGTERADLERLADSLAPGRVRFEGLVAAERVAQVLGSARAGLASVRPGKGYDFSFPTKMFASTACGTPVIYAGVGPGATVVRENDLGWAVDWDEAAVAEAMTMALARPVPAARRADLARWTTANASQDSVSERAVAAVLGVLHRAEEPFGDHGR
ncbi:glycosyltransferase family 4 protein [Pedococcus sp. NPDC057267]|uniref:glycosyltransferase family 4 protein n=1 Tax=Pedococcus sp. NPDC057267 TaxID=3346077 RepID=UPI00363E9215